MILRNTTDAPLDYTFNGQTFQLAVGESPVSRAVAFHILGQHPKTVVKVKGEREHQKQIAEEAAAAPAPKVSKSKKDKPAPRSNKPKNGGDKAPADATENQTAGEGQLGFDKPLE